MLAQRYAAFKQDLDAKGIIFSFSGYVSEGILYSLGEALREKMTLEEADGPTVRRVFSVFVEQMQNIIRYSAEKITAGDGRSIELSAGMVTIGMEDKTFFIVCANTLRSDDVPVLKERLDFLQGLDKDAIKAYYREQLREAPDEGSRGATIGLIEIARRASAPIEYDFAPLDDGKSFFCLKVRI
ncbi:SiaB family protein kinase [Azospirillum halopraeferens]|uniref:SiaB family protein kinase n=1 Tax=Azospirillum halopraeferens TaxID=34010 RepID=UPI000409F7C5|nr:SiaB family protein kinase [Azospirillum halopraeferens]